MIIAGLQKLSLVDYPGLLSAVIFLQGCNFRCGYCHNPDLVGRERSFGTVEKDVFDFLDLRKNAIDAVVISGGEPCIHEGLALLARRLSRYGLKIKLDTNGSVPAAIKGLLRDKVLDYIAVDIKTSLSGYHLVTGGEDLAGAVADSVQVVMSSGIPYEFRTTCVPGIVDEPDIREIGRMVKGAERYFLQHFRPDVTYDAAFRKVGPMETEKIRRFADVLGEYVKQVEIRGDGAVPLKQ